MQCTLRSRSSSQKPNTRSERYWSEAEHDRFLEAGYLHGFHNTVAISAAVGTRTAIQVRTHAQKWFLRTGQRPVPKVRAAAAAKPVATPRILHPTLLPKARCYCPTTGSRLYCDECTCGLQFALASGMPIDTDTHASPIQLLDSPEPWTSEFWALFACSSTTDSPQKQWSLDDWIADDPFLQ